MFNEWAFGWTGGGAGGAGYSLAPVNLRLPALTGTFVDETAVTIDVGDWTGAVSFQAEIRTGTTNAVAYAWQAVTAPGPVIVNGIVGEGLILNVWATGPGGTTLAVSALSAVVTLPEFTFYGAYAFSEVNNLPTAPYPWTVATGLPWTSRYALGNGFGWAGSSLTSVLNPYSITDVSDPVLRRVVTTNNTPPQMYFVRDVPNGTYDVYTACLCHFAAQTNKVLNVEFWDGLAIVGAPNIFRGGVASAPVSGNDQVLDAMGTVRTRAAHFAASIFGGTPRRILVTNGKISVSRNGLNNTPSSLAYVAIMRVNNP